MEKVEKFIDYFSQWDGFPKEEENLDFTQLNFLINSLLIFTKKLLIKNNNINQENEKHIKNLKKEIDNLNTRINEPCKKCKGEKSKQVNDNYNILYKNINNNEDDFISSPNKENDFHTVFSEEDTFNFSPEKSYLKETPKKRNTTDNLNCQSPVFIKSSPKRFKGLKSLSLKSKALIQEIEKTSKQEQEDKDNVKWKLKSTIMVEPNILIKGKSLKQTTLSMEPKEKNRSTQRGKRGENFSEFLNESDEDLFEPSPKSIISQIHPSKKMKKCEAISSHSKKIDADETFFIPENNKLKINSNSIEEKILPLSPQNKIPEFKYKVGRVLKQEDRKKLDGWDCEECADYYNFVCGGDKEQAKKLMNQCSRHREKYEYRYNTPPGFWDPMIPSTCDLKELDKTQDFDPYRKRLP